MPRPEDTDCSSVMHQGGQEVRAGRWDQAKVTSNTLRSLEGGPWCQAYSHKWTEMQLPGGCAGTWDEVTTAVMYEAFIPKCAPIRNRRSLSSDTNPTPLTQRGRAEHGAGPPWLELGENKRGLGLRGAPPDPGQHHQRKRPRHCPPSQAV